MKTGSARSFTLVVKSPEWGTERKLTAKEGPAGSGENTKARTRINTRSYSFLSLLRVLCAFVVKSLSVRDLDDYWRMMLTSVLTEEGEELDVPPEPGMVEVTVRVTV